MERAGGISEISKGSWVKSVKINGVNIKFEIDTGAAHTIVSVAHKLFSGKLPLIKSKIKLQTYTKDSLTALGELKVNAVVDEYCIPVKLQFILKNNIKKNFFCNK